MSRFEIITHTIVASHLREYPRATISAFTNVPALRLVVNQYVPRGRTTVPGDISIIFCHANGLHKELYEPYFDDLLAKLDSLGVGVRGIWAPDAAHEGASGILNEKALGDDVSWNDHPRDIIHLANTFAEQLPPPIFGMGHSFGGHTVVRASLYHPSLFTSLVLIDPIIEEVVQGSSPATFSMRRIDIWPSRAEAESYFRSRPFYQKWDPRCLEAQLKYGLRDLPTATYPDKQGVTLATTKQQEILTFVRASGPPGEETVSPHASPGRTWRQLHEINQPIIYIAGKQSHSSNRLANARKMQKTPDAEIAVIEDAGHLVPLEKPLEAAEVAAVHLKTQLEKWKNAAAQDYNTPRSRHLSPLFMKAIANAEKQSKL